MKSEERIPDIKMKMDNNLIQLAGYHGYLNPEKSKMIEVNGYELQVVDTTHDPVSGLEGFVVKDAHNNENSHFSIVFIGSQQLKDDMHISDLKLLYGKERSVQIEAAKTYFNRIEDMYGSGAVRAVTGISLAGSLANAIAIEHPDVRSVTLNPFMLPYGMANPSHDYPNITNYYSKNDFLTNIHETLNLGERVPGRKYHIHNGLSSSSFGSGYDRMDYAECEYQVPIGIKGEAGYGFIHVGVDDHIITSLWTGVPLYGSPSKKIDVNHNSMNTLAHSLRGKLIQRADLARVYIDKANEIAAHEHEQVNKRVSELQKSFYHIYHVTSGMSWHDKLAEKASGPQTIVEQLGELVRIVQKKTRILEKLRHDDSPEYEADITSHLQHLFTPLRDRLTRVKKSIDKYMFTKQIVIERDIPDLIKNGDGFYTDAVASELINFYSILSCNMERILDQMKNFKTQVETSAEALKEKEMTADENKPYITAGDFESMQQTGIVSLESSPYLKERMKIKKQQVDRAYEKICAIVTERLRPILQETSENLFLLDKDLAELVGSVQSILHFQENMLKPSSAFLGDAEKIDDAIQDIINPIRDIQLIVKGLEKAFIRLIDQQPELMEQFKRHIDAAVFAPSEYSNIRLYNIACSSIIDEMEILFKDITFQLSDGEDASVQGSRKMAQGIEESIKTISKQVERGIL